MALEILGAFFVTPFLPAATSGRPNILFIMADDHTSQAIGAYGGIVAPLDPTPNIDRLAREGMRLDTVFCGNSICSPSRASIISGQYSQANGVLKLEGSLPRDHQYLPLLLHDAGYATAIVGKWHLEDAPSAFDYYLTLPRQGDYFDPQFYDSTKGSYPDNLVRIHGESSDVITDAALNWLEARDKSKPFLLCLHFKAPHEPYYSAPRYASYLEDVTIPEPPHPMELGNHGSIATRGEHDELVRYIGSSMGRRHHFRNQLYYSKLRSDSPMSDDELWHASYQAFMHAYLRAIKGVDDNVGRVYAWLESQGLLENTVIVYTSDQGIWLGEHDYIDKRWMYDESMRMPLIVRYPREIKPGTTSGALISNTDFAPTLLDYAGVPTPDYMHGRSLRGILKTGRTPDGWRHAVYYRYWLHLTSHYVPAHFGIRTDKYKLIFYYGIPVHDIPSRFPIQTPPGWEFYDLSKDPGEMNNCYDDPEYARTIASLKDEMLELRSKYGETDKNYPEVQKIIDAHWNTTRESLAEAARISHQSLAQFERLRESEEAKAARIPQ